LTSSTPGVDGIIAGEWETLHGCKVVIRIFPMAGVAEALLSALDLLTAGRTDDARTLLGRILDAVPDQAAAHHLLGLAHSAQGNHGAAAARLRRAVALSPTTADYTHNLAKALLAANDASPAAADMTARAVRRAARLTPMNAEWPLYAAQLADRRGDGAGVTAACRHLAMLQPDLADPWRRMGETAHGAGAHRTAQAALTRCAVLRAGDVDAWVQAGAAARGNDDQPAAAAAFRRAAVLDPGRPDAFATLGNALKDQGKPEKAVVALRRALRLSGNDPTIEWNLALALLTAGNYAEGWPALESRWRARGFPTAPRVFEAPQWRGENPAGRALLLYEEQGRGDAIQFIRYAFPAAARGARLTVQVSPDLVPLFRRSLEGTATVISTADPVPAVDYVCPLMSLPLAFNTTVESVPAAVPYLRADPADAARWKARLAGEGLKVGLVWGGNPDFADDRRRSPGLGPLTPLLTVAGVRWFGLQTGTPRRDLEKPPAGVDLTDLGPEIRHFSDAAIIDNLDLVISSCTAALHLAAAMGRPTWGLLAHGADWRWMTDRDDSPWYPTLRLFRQPRAGDWGAVAQAAAQALEQLVDKRTKGAAP
jgi:tetratricopeptide (TPR) repeat protein